MVRILQDAPRQPSFMERLSKGVSGGITSGLDTAMKLRGEKAKADQKRELAVSRERAGLGKEINSFIKDYGHTDFTMPSLRKRLDETADDFVQKGYSKRDAVRLAHEFISEDLNKSGQGAPFQEQQSPSGVDPQWAKDLGIISDKGSMADIGIGAAKGTRPLAQFGDIGRHTGQQMNYVIGKLMGLSDEEIKQKQERVNQVTGPSLTERFDEMTGGKGKPESSFERVIAGYPMLGSGVAANLAGEALDVFGAPESVKNAGEFITFLTAHRLAPKKPPGFKFGNHVFEQAERIAAETGKTAEEVITAAQSKAGVDLGKVLSGDFVEAGKLSDALSQSSKRVTEAPKSIFNQKAAEKERSIFGKRVAESPLEEYYDIEAKAAEKASRKTAPTLAKEAEITQRLAPVEKQLSARANEMKDQLTRMQQAKRGVPESGRARIDVLIAEKEKQLAKVMSELDETRYQLKNFREKPTEAQTAKLIEENIERFRKEAKAPTPEGQAKISKDLEGDRKYLDVAAKLDKRGELPGDFKPDTYIQMQKKYLDAYKEAIKSEKDSLKGMAKSDRSSGDQFIKYLSDRVKALEAKIVKQTDKQKAIRALEKPSGAFYKQQLKETRKDLERFQKDFFKHINRVKSLEAAKANAVAKEALRETPAVAKKEPVGKQGIVEKELGRFEEKSAKVAEKELKSIKDEIPTKKEPISLKQEDKIIKKIKFAVKWGSVSAVVGTVQALVEEYSGVKPSATTIRQIGSLVTGVTAAGSFSVATQAHRAWRDFFEGIEADKIHNIKPGTDARFLYEKKMRQKRGKTQANRIMKAVHEKDSKPDQSY